MSSSIVELNQMVGALEMSGGYRILERFKAREGYGDMGNAEDLRSVMVVCMQTTGKDLRSDAIFELGYVVAQVDRKTGVPVRVACKYQGTEDPKQPLGQEVMRRTGMTSAQIQGTTFDERRVHEDLARASLVVVRGAESDRLFLEKRFPGFREKWFASVDRDVDWPQYGASNTELDYLAFKLCSAFFEPGRSLLNAEVLTFILSQEIVDVGRPLKDMLEALRAPRLRVWLRSAPPDKRAMLRAAGWKLNGASGPYDMKGCMYIETTDPDEKLEWLAEHVHPAIKSVTVDKVTGLERYSPRYSARMVLDRKPKPPPAPAAPPPSMPKVEPAHNNGLPV